MAINHNPRMTFNPWGKSFSLSVDYHLRSRNEMKGMRWWEEMHLKQLSCGNRNSTILTLVLGGGRGMNSTYVL